MFIHREDDPSGIYMISQASHAWMAWQVAERWGNRDFLRPAPRAETLAAVLLHDGAWTDYDAAPGVDGRGRPRTFNRMSVVDHLQIWRRSVARAADHSRYTALLVASHFAFLAGLKVADLLEREDTAGARSAQSFIAEMERLQRSWREALKVDPRYEPYLTGDGWQNNTKFLAACDRISVYLCACLGSPFTVEVCGRGKELTDVELSEREPGAWRVRPWPLEGDTLRLHCEARRLSASRFASDEELHLIMAQAPVVRLSFSLSRPSATG